MSGSDDAIVIGADHAGYEMKEFIRAELERRGIPYHDAGAYALEPLDDYPVFASRVAGAVADGTYRRGITACGTGIGASITANRFKGVRAALCTSADMARLARQHNDSNVLVLGGRTTGRGLAAQILDAWLSTPTCVVSWFRRLT